MYPPGSHPGHAWKTTTIITAMVLRPSISGLYEAELLGSTVMGIYLDKSWVISNG